MRLHRGLLGVTFSLLFASSAWADFVVSSTAGAGWQTWVAPANNGGEFWDNTSDDGVNCNIGFWLLGTATGCSNSAGLTAGLPAGVAPGNIPYWGLASGANDPGYHFTSSIGNHATLKIEIAGNRNFNSFGWYDLGSPGVLNELFSGPTSPETTATFTPTTNFGYYIVDKGGFTWRTEGSIQQRFALFREQPTGTTGTEASVYWLGVEDLPLAGDRDYNDLVVRVAAVPEPSAYVVLIAGLAGVAYTVRRRRAAQAQQQN